MKKGDGMSFAEFAYPLMQAWDWWQLYQQGVQIQIGGADQFGNILAGAEAIKYMVKNDPEFLDSKRAEEQRQISSTKSQDMPPLTPREEKVDISQEAMGFTVPLLTTSAGEKFGKSAGNAIWLDKEMTSTFDLYQVSLDLRLMGTLTDLLTVLSTIGRC